MTQPIHLATLGAAWIQAKADEDAAKARRYEIEAQIVAAMPVKEEGTAKADDAGLRISVTHKLTRAIDTDAVRSAWDSISPAAQAALRWKADLDARAYRALADQDAQQLAPFITTKPSKPAVKVEPITD